METIYIVSYYYLLLPILAHAHKMNELFNKILYISTVTQ